MPETRVTVRCEEAGDAPGVRAVLEQAFATGDEAALVDAVRARNKAGLSLVAASGGRVIAHVLFTPLSFSSGERGPEAVALGPVAVLPAFQGRGVGSRLIREGIGECRRMGKDAVFVLGEPRFYRRFGFSPASGYGIGNEYDAGDAFMALELRPGGLHGAGGTACYISEFKEFGG
jgi:putative acetyltransferase